MEMPGVSEHDPAAEARGARMTSVRCTCYGEVTVLPTPTHHVPHCMISLTRSIADLTRRIELLEAQRRVEAMQRL